MENRIFRLREFLKQQNCDGVIINKEETCIILVVLQVMIQFLSSHQMIVI